MSIEQIDRVISCIDFQQLITKLYAIKNNDDESEFDVNSLDLLSFPVTSKSIFMDEIWDYTADFEVAKTLTNTRLIIDFSAYENIPISIIAEIKVALIYHRMLPSQPQIKARRKKPLTIQTSLPMVKSWLDFMDYCFKQIAIKYGAEFSREEYGSLINFTVHDYKLLSDGYVKAESTVHHIEKVFEWFSCDQVIKVLYSHQPFIPKTSHLSITIVETVKDNREKVIRDDIFEKAVAISSQLVCDFLRKMEIPIKDKMAESRLDKFHFDLPSIVVDANPSIIEHYIGVRLYRKKFNLELIKSLLDMKLVGDVRPTDFIKPKDGTETLLKYTKLVHDAALYIIAQFTGMRPSELVEIRADKPLTSSFDIPCITSIVHKKRSVSRRLFDDLWVAIPAVEDAMSALTVLTRIRNNPFIFSKSETIRFGEKPKILSHSISYVLENYFSQILTSDEFSGVDFFPYMMRHTLAYQMYKVNLGLPFISHQLKHFGNLVQAVGSASNKGFSMDTMSYGDIGDMLSGAKAEKNNLRHQAEVYVVKEMYDPNGSFAGVNAEAHKKRLKKLFEGYQSAGYSNEDVFEAMAEQGIAVVNVGTGMCYGGRAEDFDESLPCIGSLRCNPNRCHQAVITKAHIPKWREVYEQNMKVVSLGESETNYRQAVEAVNEAKGVLEYLGVFK